MGGDREAADALDTRLSDDERRAVMNEVLRTQRQRADAQVCRALAIVFSVLPILSGKAHRATC